MRKCLDSLQTVRTPIVLRQVSQDFEDQFAELDARIRQFSDSSDERLCDKPDKVLEYLMRRRRLIEDIEQLHRQLRNFWRKARANKSFPFQRGEINAALRELDESNQNVQRERVVLVDVRARAQVKHLILGRPNSVSIGKAYKRAKLQAAPSPDDAPFFVHSRSPDHRSATDLTAFRNRLIKTYNTDSNPIENTSHNHLDDIWCPITDTAHPAETMVAAHIVPHAIGEVNIAYLFGSKAGDGYELLWSVRNGLMLHATFEKLFDNGQMLIIPDPNDQNEFITVIVDENLRKSRRIFQPTQQLFTAYHKKRLHFRTAARPGRRYLYMHTLLSLFCRRKYAVPGWENDREQVLTDNIWATPTKALRKSFVQALALELGDSWKAFETVNGLAEFPDGKSPEEERTLATIMRYSLEHCAMDEDSEDEESEDENSENENSENGDIEDEDG